MVSRVCGFLCCSGTACNPQKRFLSEFGPCGCASCNSRGTLRFLAPFYLLADRSPSGSQASSQAVSPWVLFCHHGCLPLRLTSDSAASCNFPNCFLFCLNNGKEKFETSYFTSWSGWKRKEAPEHPEGDAFLIGAAGGSSCSLESLRENTGLGLGE